MPRTCPLSKKKPVKIKRRSHSMQSTTDYRKPNLVVKRVGNKKVRIAASALKLLKKKNIKLNTLKVLREN